MVNTEEIPLLLSTLSVAGGQERCSAGTGDPMRMGERRCSRRRRKLSEAGWEHLGAPGGWSVCESTCRAQGERWHSEPEGLSSDYCGRW